MRKVAVFMNTLPPPGPEMDRLKGFVIGGNGLLVVLGKDITPASLAALTNDAIKEGNAVEAAEGPYHAAEAEKLGAEIEYAGPPNDPLRDNISWKSAVRVFERWILNVNRGEVLVATSDKDPVHPHTPILVQARTRARHHLRAQCLDDRGQPGRAGAQLRARCWRGSRARATTTSSAGRISTGCCMT